MRWLLVMALLAPSAAAAQSLSIELPAWCTESTFEPATALVHMRAYTDLEEVDVGGTVLPARDGAFVGNIDLLPYIAPRHLADPIQDVELVAIATGRRGMAAAKGICRIGRTGFDLVEVRLPDVAARGMRWAARYAGEAPHPAVVILDAEVAWRHSLPRVSFVWSGWDPGSALEQLQLVALVHAERRVLGRCAECQLDAKATPDEKRPCLRTQEIGNVRLLEAHTGRQVAATSIAANTPPACHAEMTFGEAATVIREAAVEEWIETVAR